jgi:DNA (cytosine-5)-methyltransferase 1
MINVKFYLDKADKSKKFPIHLVIRQKDVQVKVATGEKILKKDWDNKNQVVKESEYTYKSINKFLLFLQQEVEKYFDAVPHSQFTDKKVKEKILSLVNSRKVNTDIKMVCEDAAEYEGKTKTPFVDLFAGAGGFSEGFLQAEHGNRYYDFLLGSDINENCELTHLARYNYQLGMDAEFLRQDITEPDFLDNLLQKLKSQQVDVVCGGPPCQSFSIAGRRDKNDPRNSLFIEFVKYLKYFNPKAFIMENVIGILSKKTENNEKVIDIIMEQLTKDYNCVICKLYASDFEVPQNRRRAIIIGVRNSDKIEKDFAAENKLSVYSMKSIFEHKIENICDAVMEAVPVPTI